MFKGENMVEQWCVGSIVFNNIQDYKEWLALDKQEKIKYNKRNKKKVKEKRLRAKNYVKV
jgi:hypothetical protein